MLTRRSGPPRAPGRWRCNGAVVAIAATGFVAPARAQTPPTIDSIAIERQNITSDSQAESNPFAGLMNGLHVTTRTYVIRSELLFDVGDAVDSLLLAESERNLRARGLFRSVRIDTTTLNGKLTATIRTRDAWSLLPRANVQIASDGRFTGTFGLTEANVAGTGSRLRVWYVRETDRDGFVFSGGLPRVGGGNVAASGSWASLSDLDAATWTFSTPFRSNSDRRSFFYEGQTFEGRVRQYRAIDANVADTTDFHRRAFINRVFYTVAPIARPEGYLRVGVSAEIRREEYILEPNPAIDRDSVFALVPDTVYAGISVFSEYRQARFVRMGRFNGFTEEDQDISNLIFVSAALAPAGWGYESTGIGARAVLRAGARAGPTLLKAAIDGNALFNGAGLDSGRVVATGTVAVRTAERHATFVQISGGMQDRPPPGGQFDLGFQINPRLWGPHAFVGTRSFRATLEHRFFMIDNIADLIGLGLAGFVDYGGAWYRDQDARLGGNAGVSVFFGSPLSSLAQVSHLSAGYRFGGGIEGTDLARWSFSLGSGIVF